MIDNLGACPTATGPSLLTNPLSGGEILSHMIGRQTGADDSSTDHSPVSRQTA
jgi:hypothetical protein